PPRSSRPAPPPPQRAPRPRAGRESSLRGGDRHGAPAAAPRAPRAHSPLSAGGTQHAGRVGVEMLLEPARSLNRSAYFGNPRVPLRVERGSGARPALA